MQRLFFKCRPKIQFWKFKWSLWFGLNFLIFLTLLRTCRFPCTNFDFLICRFNTVAYLQQTWWFQVDGEIDFCFPAGTYSLFYRVFLGRPSQRFGWRTCDTSHVHGWDKKPVRFELSTSCGQQAIKQCYLLQQENWVHYHVGDFSVEDSNIPTKVKFSMMQIDCTHTKGGLCMDSVLIYPKGYTRPRKPFAI